MPGPGSRPMPKPRPRVLDRVEYKREAEKKARDFRAAVWKRDDGICQRCGVKCLRTITLDVRRGEVHHLKPRSISPENRYNVALARLYCLQCHTDWHGGAR